MINPIFVIKLDSLYFDKHSNFPSGSYVRNPYSATKYAHPDNARQDIKELMLGENHKVYQLNFVESEVKS